MDLKLRNNLEAEPVPVKPTKKQIDITEARLMVARIELSSDKKKLLHDLRSCRDIVKALVAGYDRRSITS
jgi:ethanolamine utilization cobalamin adenosyltransferase